MKIVEQLPTLLKLEQKGDSFWGRYFSYIFSFLISSIPLYFGLKLMHSEVTTLKCDRVEPTQVSCKFISSHLLDERITPIPTEQLKGVELKKTESDDGYNYSIILVTRSNKIPLSAYSSSFFASEEIANQIDTFIKNPERMTLEIRQNNRGAYIFGVILIVIGGYSICCSFLYKIQYYCVFDKISGLMYMKSRNFFKSEFREQMLSDIKEARVVEEIDRNSDSNRKTYRTELVLRSGEQIELQMSGFKPRHYEVARAINEFLGVESRSGVSPENFRYGGEWGSSNDRAENNTKLEIQS